ncbi:MAG: SpoIIE family protein phosphatase [Bryobacteraceae bacterium]|nr:SpoIIE family protein phosphatase [Bryobacteraceae bacterium]
MPRLRRALLAVLFCIVVAVQVRWATSTLGRFVAPPRNPELINAVNSSLVVQEGPGIKITGGAVLTEDRIIAFAGQPVTQRAELYRELQRAALGPTTLTLLRGGETIVVPYKVFSLTDESDNLWGAALTVVLNILMPGLCALLGFFVAWRRPTEAGAWMLLITLLGWSQLVHSNFWMHWGWNDVLRTASFALQNSATALWPAAWLWFCVDFPDRRRRPLLHPLRLFFGLAALFNGLIAGSIGAWYATQPGPPAWQSLLEYLPRGTSNLLSFGPIGLSFAALFHRFFRERQPDQRRRLRLLLTGLNLGLLPIGLMLLYTFLAKKTLDDLPLLILIPGLLAFASLPVSLAYVVLVERAFDVGVVVRQGLQYALATRGLQALRILLIGGVLLYAFTIGGDTTLNRPQRLTRFALSVLAVIVIARAFVPLLAWLDRRFFREAVDTERLLNQLQNHVATIFDRRELLETVAVRVSQALHVPCVAALVPVNGHYMAAHAIGCSAEAQIPTDGAIARRVRTGPQTISQLRTLIHEPEFAALEHLSTEILLPLTAQERMLGILSLGPKQSEQPYSPADLRLLESVALHTGLALENSRLTSAVADEAAQRERIHREIEIAREVQERLLPRGGPAVPGLDYAGHCRPALTIGGDYFDYLQTPSGEIGFALGDIAGKGVPAALLMASLQASLRGLTAGGVADLRELMAKLNTLVYDATPKNRFATFVYVLYEPQTRRARLCSAGHNASLLLRDGKAEWIRPPGIALGLTRKTTYEQVEFTLIPGDRLILYTDGITEARNAVEDEFGEDRLASLALTLTGLNAPETLTALIAGVDQFAGPTPQHDDLTALVLRAI